MEWDLEGCVDSTLTLETFKVCDTLPRQLDLDDKCSNGGDDVEVVALDMVFRQGQIELPDGSRSLDVGNSSNNAHKSGDGEVDNVCKAQEAMLVGIEGVNSVGIEGGFNVVARHVIVARIIYGDTKKLNRNVSIK